MPGLRRPGCRCPNRFDPAATGREGPRGRDYMGGDLKGVDQQIDYLASLGVNAIYFNPIFDAASNHSYDTQDYKHVDPYFGSQKDFDNLVKHAKSAGIRVILDGVFNHMSSDSPLFDRYHHYATVGACESTSSPYRTWFVFSEVGAGNGNCAGANGPSSADYEGWFGFDSIPVLLKTQAAVQAYFLTAPDSVAKHWILAGASGWRLDVSGDPSFPNGYWESFRDVVKAANPQALTISETWQKDSTLLRMVRGDRLDTTMNYRFRDAVLGFLAPQDFDPKGFADSGHAITPSTFLSRLASAREDYSDATYYSLMNLLDSHDTERLLWTLTPGPDTPANKEANAASVAAGKARLRLASLIQFTVPGAPTVYYGDEVGMTGDDDPDDRRTYPWADLGGTPDTALFSHYQSLAALRRERSGPDRRRFPGPARGRRRGCRGLWSEDRLERRDRRPQPVRLAPGGPRPDRRLPPRRRHVQPAVPRRWAVRDVGRRRARRDRSRARRRRPRRQCRSRTSSAPQHRPHSSRPPAMASSTWPGPRPPAPRAITSIAARSPAAVTSSSGPPPTPALQRHDRSQRHALLLRRSRARRRGQRRGRPPTRRRRRRPSRSATRCSSGPRRRRSLAARRPRRSTARCTSRD